MQPHRHALGPGSTAFFAPQPARICMLDAEDDVRARLFFNGASGVAEGFLLHPTFFFQVVGYFTALA